jgi:endonuclease YncB( thermonuclease family)
VRLVQIDTPEVNFGVECYGRQASATTKRLLPPETRVNLLPEPATDRVDQYGRLLRYVVRARGGVKVNLRLVATGAAAPWRACPRTHLRSRRRLKLPSRSPDSARRRAGLSGRIRSRRSRLPRFERTLL